MCDVTKSILCRGKPRSLISQINKDILYTRFCEHLKQLENGTYDFTDTITKSEVQPVVQAVASLKCAECAAKKVSSKNIEKRSSAGQFEVCDHSTYDAVDNNLMKYMMNENYELSKKYDYKNYKHPCDVSDATRHEADCIEFTSVIHLYSEMYNVTDVQEEMLIDCFLAERMERTKDLNDVLVFSFCEPFFHDRVSGLTQSVRKGCQKVIDATKEPCNNVLPESNQTIISELEKLKIKMQMKMEKMQMKMEKMQMKMEKMQMKTMKKIDEIVDKIKKPI